MAGSVDRPPAAGVGVSLVLPYSRHLFVRPAENMTQRAWVEAHVAVLEFLGGALRRIVTGYVARNIIGVLCQVALQYVPAAGWMTLGADVMAKPVLGLFT